MPHEIPPAVRDAWQSIGDLRRERDELIREAPRQGGLDRADLSRLDRRIAGLLEDIRDLVDPCDASPTEPVVLLPVRLETRYAADPQDGARSILQVRIYPDAIHVDDVVRGLTDEEVTAGQAYWSAVWVEPVPEGAFDALVGTVGPRRAEWVAYACTPVNLADRAGGGGAGGAGGGSPRFPTPAARSVRNVVARALPDRFTVVVEQAGQRVVATGAPVPRDLPMAPVPLDGDQPVTADGQLRLGAGSEWLVDFPAAQAVGMGVVVPLPAGRAPIDRVVALGTRSSASPGDGAAELEDLLVGHRFGGGLGLVPQGTPTNNSDAERSPLRSRRTPTAPALAPPVVSQGSDPDAAAAALGLDPGVLTGLLGPGAGEQATAKAVNTALWAPGWGAFLEILDEGGVLGITDGHREAARQLFRDHVRGRGVAPVLRVREQPYGILPVSDLRRWQPAAGENRGVLPVVRGLLERWSRVIDRTVDRVRPDRADLDETLVEILGASPVMRGLRARPFVSGALAQVAGPALGLDPDTYAAEQSIRAAVLAESVNASVASLRMGSLADDDRPIPLPLASDRDPEFISALLGNPSKVLAVDSVLQALLVLAWRSHELDAVKAAPATVLPQLVGLAGVGDRLAAQTTGLVARAELTGSAEFLELAARVEQQTGTPAGGAALLAAYTPVPATQASLAEIALTAPAGKPATSLAQAALAGWLLAMGYRAEVREAMTALTTVSTTERELAVAEALDCSSHRLDAWATALVAQRRARQRSQTEGGRGVTVGAWGVVEELAPTRGPDTQGWIHAPSTRHASAAGLLRNAHLAHLGADAGAGGGSPFALDLTSVRLDAATHVLDGVRAGQSLAALVGYQIERGLAAARLARLQLSLRTIAPLRAEQLHESSGPDADLAREALAATDVVDGLLLLDRHPPGDLGLRRLLDVPPVNAYLDPGDWEPLTDDEWVVVTRILTEAADTVDAVADVLLAESVVQYAGGNSSRAAAAMDALGSGGAPATELDVLDTQEAAERLTHRVLAVAGGGAATLWRAGRPRAQAEPALEAWVSAHLGSPASIVVADRSAAGDGLLTLDAAGWCALDLAYAGDQGALEHTLRADLPGLAEHELAVHPDPAWPAGHRSIAQAFGLATTMRALLSGGTPMLPDALTRPGARPARDLALSRADLTARVATAAGSLAAAVAALAPTIATIPADGFVADEPTAAAYRAAIGPLAAFGVLGQPVPSRPLDVGWVRAAYESARARADDAAALVAQLVGLGPDTPGGLILDAAQAIADAVFGDGFVVVPVLEPAPGGDDLAAAVTDPAFPDPPRAAVRRFIRDHATVREQVGRYAEVLLVGAALGGDPTPRVAQLAERPDTGPAPGTTHWLAGPLPAEGPWPTAPVAHLVLDAVGLDDPAGPLSGLVIDAWVEDLPNQPGPPRDPADVQPNELAPGLATTGLAVRADAPSARPPQVILSAISPDGQRWTTDSLHSVITSTLELAKLRLVRLDTMPGDAVALPALYVRSSSLQGEQALKWAALVEASKAYTAMPFVKEAK